MQPPHSAPARSRSPAASGTGGFNKTGPGTMLLTGTNDSTGGTTVGGGTLVVNGSIASSSLTTVASAATLSGSGTVGATLIEGGGFHAPGTSPGIQTITSGLEYQSAATLTWELVANTAAGRGTSYDGIDLTGGSLVVDPAAILALSFGTSGGGSSVSWSDSFPGGDRSWTIVDVGATATWDGSLFGVLSVGSDAFGQSLASLRPDAGFSVANVGGDLTLQYRPCPSPPRSPWQSPAWRPSPRLRAGGCERSRPRSTVMRPAGHWPRSTV